jgi:hypothetical protein
MAHAVTIPSPNREEVVITTPLIPGLELRLPPGTVIRDLDGKVVTQLSITPVPTDRPPFPLPPGPQVPVFASIQPGGARVIPPRARLIYPNYNNERPGKRINFWNYDPEEKGWYIYGQGTVTADGRQIVPDAGVVIYEFNGIMIGDAGNPPDKGREAGDDDEDGDPVDLSTGLFVLEKTDLVLPDIIPIALTRTYRPGDAASRPFGIGSSHPYELFLWSNNNYQEADLILPDGGRIHYVRVSSGTGFTDAVYEHTTTPSAFTNPIFTGMAQAGTSHSRMALCWTFLTLLRCGLSATVMATNSPLRAQAAASEPSHRSRHPTGVGSSLPTEQATESVRSRTTVAGRSAIPTTAAAASGRSPMQTVELLNTPTILPTECSRLRMRGGLCTLPMSTTQTAV